MMLPPHANDQAERYAADAVAMEAAHFLCRGAETKVAV